MAKIKEIVKEDVFKNNPVLVFTNGEDDKYPFSLGLTKLQNIVEHIDEVYDFLKKHGKM